MEQLETLSSDPMKCVHGSGLKDSMYQRRCERCPRGHSCAGGLSASFVACDKGTFANESAMSSCHLCPEGYFASEVGSVACSPCVPGMVAPNKGMESCRRCEPGSYRSSPRGTHCESCGNNQITSESGASDHTRSMKLHYVELSHTLLFVILHHIIL